MNVGVDVKAPVIEQMSQPRRVFYHPLFELRLAYILETHV